MKKNSGGIAMKKFCAFFLLSVFLAACSPKSEPAAAVSLQPAISDSQESAAESPVSAACALESTPQKVSFTASDGQELQGYFYPACAKGAPVVVLMHWIAGNKADWYEIAAWLQNRGLENPFKNPGSDAWWDASWFPANDPAISYNVFIFSFRGCKPYETGCRERDLAGWLLDANAAMLKAQKLEGVDAGSVAVIGSSIGADGAADSCLGLNEQKPGACRGALSLSPGSYLGVSYPEVVQKMGELAAAPQVWCLADEDEIAVCDYAAGSNPNFRSIQVDGGGHGNELLRPGLTPSPMEAILDFLETALTE
jgi:hypothetical protein